MESESKSKTVAQRFLFLSSQDRKDQTSGDHFEDSLYLSFWGSHAKSAACAHSHTLSFSSHCQGAEGGGQMWFKSKSPWGSPRLIPSTATRSLSLTPHTFPCSGLSWGKAVSAQGKWDPAGPVLYFPNPMLFHPHGGCIPLIFACQRMSGTTHLGTCRW